MSRPLALAALLLAATLSLAPAQQPTIAPAPVPGPVGLSVGNEARTALLRAERWLRRNAPDFPDTTLPALAPLDDAELALLLPLLQSQPPSDARQENRYEALYRLATALADRGAPVVFLPDGTSIPWRNAILHDLVTTQHPDDRGGGYWTTLPDASPDDILLSLLKRVAVPATVTIKYFIFQYSSRTFQGLLPTRPPASNACACGFCRC